MLGEQREIEVEGFAWDFEPDGNVAHLAGHDVRIADVNAVLAFGPMFLRSLSEHAATYVMVGRDNRNRSLLIYPVATPEHGIWKPVTGWQSGDAHRLLQEGGRLS